jgi:hypothetical protein
MSLNSRIFARAALLLTTACAWGCGAGSPSGEQGAASEQAAISGGQLDSTDSNVFLLVSHRTGGIALCSASLIAPNLLLTARHCVSDVTSDQVSCGKTEASAPFAPNTFVATNASSLDNATVFYSVSAVSVPSNGTDICGFDIALVTLKTLVPASVATPLVPRVDRAVTSGESYSAVGYGLDMPGDAGIAGERRERTGMTVSCAPGACTGAVEADEFVGQAGICSGDSGGPALDANGEVVGVVSRSADDCNLPVYGAVAAWKDWIVGVLQQAAAQGNYTAPAWATTPGTQGESCAGPTDCQSSFGCYSPSHTKTPNDGYCAAFCTDQTQCTSGTQCDLAVGKAAGLSMGVCIAQASPAGNGSSCAVDFAGRPRGGQAWLAFAGLGLVLVATRKRRR